MPPFKNVYKYDCHRFRRKISDNMTAFFFKITSSTICGRFAHVNHYTAKIPRSMSRRGAHVRDRHTTRLVVSIQVGWELKLFYQKWRHVITSRAILGSGEASSDARYRLSPSMYNLCTRKGRKRVTRTTFRASTLWCARHRKNNRRSRSEWRDDAGRRKEWRHASV